MNRRLLNIATLQSLVLFVLSAATLAANVWWGERYGYVGHRPQYVVALDAFSLIVQRQDGDFGLRIPLLLTSILFAALPAAWLDRLRRRPSAAREDVPCPNCGYDLRATPLRCPECGAVPPERPA